MKKISLSAKINNRVLKYSTAASLGAFTLGNATVANISIGDASLSFGPGGTVTNANAIDIDGDSNDDFDFTLYSSAVAVDSFRMQQLNGAKLFSSVYAGNIGYVANPMTSFTNGSLIKSELVGRTAFESSNTNPLEDGPFLATESTNSFNIAQRYLGIKTSGGLLGWIEILIDSTTDNNWTVTVSNYGYETSGGTINAGQIPEPSTYSIGLGLLALGAAGLKARKSISKK